MKKSKGKRRQLGFFFFLPRAGNVLAYCTAHTGAAPSTANI
jgi:hypothetical protein